MHSIAEKIANPGRFYNSPQRVIEDKQLRLEEKLRMLSNWLDDIFLSQVAEEENMLGASDRNQEIAELEQLLDRLKIELLGCH